MSEVVAAVGRRRRVGLGAGVLASVLALSLGLGAVPAQAADLSAGHIDFVSVGTSGTSLALGSNFDDTGFVPSNSYTLKVPSTSGASGTGYILPQSETEAAARGVPYAGFSGDESLRDAPFSFAAGNTVTVKLVSVSYVPAPGVTGPAGTVSISQGTASWFTNASKTQTFTVTGSSGEAWHQHAQWVFSKAGTYTLTFSASGKGKTATSQTYTVKAGI